MRWLVRAGRGFKPRLQYAECSVCMGGCMSLGEWQWTGCVKLWYRWGQMFMMTTAEVLYWAVEVAMLSQMHKVAPQSIASAHLFLRCQVYP